LTEPLSIPGPCLLPKKPNFFVPQTAKQIKNNLKRSVMPGLVPGISEMAGPSPAMTA
jgi:hypothetical protein